MDAVKGGGVTKRLLAAPPHPPAPHKCWIPGWNSPRCHPNSATEPQGPPTPHPWVPPVAAPADAHSRPHRARRLRAPHILPLPLLSASPLPMLPSPPPHPAPYGNFGVSTRHGTVGGGLQEPQSPPVPRGTAGTPEPAPKNCDSSVTPRSSNAPPGHPHVPPAPLRPQHRSREEQIGTKTPQNRWEAGGSDAPTATAQRAPPGTSAPNLPQPPTSPPPPIAPHRPTAPHRPQPSPQRLPSPRPCRTRSGRSAVGGDGFCPSRKGESWRRPTALGASNPEMQKEILQRCPNGNFPFTAAFAELT